MNMLLLYELAEEYGASSVVYGKVMGHEPVLVIFEQPFGEYDECNLRAVVAEDKETGKMYLSEVVMVGSIGMIQTAPDLSAELRGVPSRYESEREALADVSRRFKQALKTLQEWAPWKKHSSAPNHEV